VEAVTGWLDRGDGVELAWERQSGASPTVVFLPGFRSEMVGNKATALATFCAKRGLEMLRFDYSGHGASRGRFEDGTISRWTDEALAMIDRLTTGPLALVGCSMGGWIALLVALVRPERVVALIGVAAAPDFTEALMWTAMSFEQRFELMRLGVLDMPGRYGGPHRVTRALIEDGRTRLLLNAPIALACPVRLIHGQNDPDVPWETALRIAEQLTGQDVQVVLVKDGDHRLSRPQDLALLQRTLAPLLSQDRT
jgi:pimeloyl-ACP methyl ester carboxylesterase